MIAAPQVKGARMLVLLGVILGAILGPLRARKLGGKRADLLQYGFVYGVIGALLGLFATIIIHRMAL